MDRTIGKVEWFCLNGPRATHGNALYEVRRVGQALNIGAVSEKLKVRDRVMEVKVTTQGKKVLADALALPPTERASLVEEILSSFDFPSCDEVDVLWAREAEDRIDAYERGEMRSIPAQEVFDRIDRQQRG